MKNETKKKREIQRKQYEKYKSKENCKSKTMREFGSAKKYWCVLCKSLDQEVSAVQWHHYTNPYQYDKAIPLCKFHHSNFHMR